MQRKRIYNIFQNQFGFLLSRHTQALFLLRKLMEKFWEKKMLHMAFIDLMKSHGMVQGI